VAETFRGYPVKVRRFDLAGRTFELLGPDEYERLLDDPRVLARFQHDEFMPYWAEFWPASLLLADEVASWPPVDPSISAPLLLEIGCGLGLVGLVAASRGYRVIASDYDDDALAFVVESARHNNLPTPETRFVDWREFYPDLELDRIVAAEILYEARNLRPVAEFLRNHLKPDGEAIIVDANRSTADNFESIATDCGLTAACRALERPGYNDPKPIRGRAFRVSRRAE
jgi:SAM-dependent methyltransferase